ncbi:MAG: DUF1992 domain-containing protein, partial [Ktedonobacteraceae bacterium]
MGHGHGRRAGIRLIAPPAVGVRFIAPLARAQHVPVNHHTRKPTGIEYLMDFKDWRKASDTPGESEKARSNKYRGKQYHDHIEEQIHEAQLRGDFDNLPGAGKPLNLDDGSYAGDRALGYRLLKSNGYAPREVELSKEIRTAAERAETRLTKIRHQGQTLRTRRVPPFPSEK